MPSRRSISASSSCADSAIICARIYATARLDARTGSRLALLVVVELAAMFADRLSESARTVVIVYRLVERELCQLVDQAKQVRPAVAAGLGWWDSSDTAGSVPVKAPGVVCRTCPEQLIQDRQHSV
jgi:hypothetical protein